MKDGTITKVTANFLPHESLECIRCRIAPEIKKTEVTLINGGKGTFYHVRCPACHYGCASESIKGVEALWRILQKTRPEQEKWEI